PSAFGLPAELWYPLSLTRYINSVAEQEGYPRMATASEFSIRKILRKAMLNPHKVTYYCEKRDPDFEKKMHDVLVIYKQVELRFDENGSLIPFAGDEEPVHTLSYDEKPGIQAIATTSGDALPLVSNTHKSSDFVTFLKILDEKYPKGGKIRLILDNHSAHTSRETQEYLNTVPGRFEFVFTPTHGSWLNMVEGFFSKMTRQMLSGIRAGSKEELKGRILKYFEEINEVPVPYKWKYRLDTIDLSEESPENQGKRAPKARTRKPRNQITTNA
uniref:transposase n=1 Tax=Enterocloster clostridioformis TaxID=1531 RepID=UPI0025A6295D